MNYSFVVKPRADTDMNEARDWYEGQRFGLGEKFVDRVLETFEIVKRSPLASRVRAKGIRRLPVKGFPYSVFYRIIKNRIAVVAIYHDKRDPKGWMSRR